MPFQSEKQRRYLHANHPEIAKRWERDYAHGGILDINESEEIISDDGNEIELTDYNAAFDEPTGVQSLFQAKEGGTPRRRYFTGAYGVGGTENRGSTRGGNGGYQNVHQTGAVSQTPGRTTTPTSTGGDGPINIHYDSPKVKEQQRKTEMLNLIRREQLEKGPPEYYGLRKLELDQADLQTRIQEKITGDWKRYMNPSTWDKVKNIYAFTSISGAIKEIAKGIKRSKDMRAFLQDLEDIGLAGGPPGTNDPLYDQLWLHLEKMDPKYKKETKDEPEGPIYAPLTGAVDEEYAQGYYDSGMSDLDRIRAGQAKYAAYIDKIEREKAMFANKGGLANLFRVKKQQQEKNMRNDFGTRPYKSRFPYKAGKKKGGSVKKQGYKARDCLLYTSPSPRDRQKSRMPSSA